jgi:hypothetical protein
MKYLYLLMIIFYQPIVLSASPIDSSKVKAEQVVMEFVQALKSNQYDKIGRLYHPESLSDLKRYLIQIAKVEKDQQSKKMLLRSYGISDSIDNIFELDSISLMSNYYRIAMSSLPASSIFGNIRIIGSIGDGRYTIHVLIKNEVSVYGMAISDVEVQTLKQMVNGGFGLILPDKMIIMLKAAIYRNTSNQLFK